MTGKTKWAVGVLYPLFVILAVALLAAVQQRSPVGTAFDTWRLNYNAARALLTQDQQLFNNLRKDDIADLDQISTIDECLKLFGADGALRPELVDPRLQQEANQARASKRTLEINDGDVFCVFKGLHRLKADRNYSELLLADRKRDREELSKSIARVLEQIETLSKMKPEYMAFIEMEKSWYTKFISATPYDLLILFMVMFMGALGGMVRLLRDYGDTTRAGPASSDYFFIPLIGLVVAIGGYLLAKTGLLLLSTAKDDAGLSPFMIGLVGVISGLMAKDVIDALARAGANIVTQNGAPAGPPLPAAPPPAAAAPPPAGPPP